MMTQWRCYGDDERDLTVRFLNAFLSQGTLHRAWTRCSLNTKGENCNEKEQVVSKRALPTPVWACTKILRARSRVQYTELHVQQSLLHSNAFFSEQCFDTSVSVARYILATVQRIAKPKVPLQSAMNAQFSTSIISVLTKCGIWSLFPQQVTYNDKPAKLK